MTLIIAIKCTDGVVIASDGRVVRGGEYRAEEKIFQIGERLIVGAAGRTGVIKRIIRALRGLTTDLRSEESIRKIETTLANIYQYHQETYGRNYQSKEKFDEEFYGSLLAIDSENIYRFFFDGYPEPCGDYEAIGSASGYVRTLLETFYEKGMDTARASELAVYCILQGMKVSRDIGEPIQIGVVKRDGQTMILGEDQIKEIIRKINGRERMLHDIWSILAKWPEVQEELEKFVEEKLASIKTTLKK